MEDICYPNVDVIDFFMEKIVSIEMSAWITQTVEKWENVLTWILLHHQESSATVKWDGLALIVLKVSNLCHIKKNITSSMNYHNHF